MNPARAADDEAVACLLRCWVRETGVTMPADGVLRLDLASSGARLVAPVSYWSRVGRHRFGPVRLDTGAPARATTVAELLAAEAAKDRGAPPDGVADLVERVDDSVRRVTEHLAARAGEPGEPPGTTPFLAAEQALLTGHPLHPAPKSRAGLTAAEAAAYSPELRGAFPLHWFAAHRSVVSSDSALHGPPGTPDASAEALVAALAEGALAPPPGTVLVPAHPWQARDLATRGAIRALMGAGLLHDLGPAGPAWHPTSSLRTCYRPGAPVMVKLSLALRITNSRRENLRKELRRGLEIHRLFDAGLGAALQAAHPGFDVVRDPAWLAVDPPGDAEQSGLELVLRDNPFGPHDDVACVAGLVAERPDRPDGRSGLARVVHGLAARTGRPVGVVAAEWFVRYLEAVVVPVLWLHAAHGLALEAHQQNTLVVLGTDGWPAGGRYRDNQGYYVAESRAGDLAAWLPGAGTSGESICVDAVVDERLGYYLGINNLLGLVGALGSQGLADEGALLGAARRVLARFDARLARERTPRSRAVRTLLDSPTLRCKANLLTRVAGLDELVGPLETQSVYVDLPNPLAAVGP
ncbi:MAG: IucA/IucC family protein [Carbonactinosporaceae bacterium]